MRTRGAAQRGYPKTAAPPPKAPRLSRPRVFWFPPTKTWAVRLVPLKDKTERLEFQFYFDSMVGGVYNPDMQVWTFPEENYDEAIRILNEYYPWGLDISQKIEINVPPPVVHAALNSRRVFETLTGEVPLSLGQAKRAYYRAAQRLHPDHGGDTSEMADLSQAWAFLQKELS